MSHKQIALLSGMLTVVLLTVTAPAIGLTWDEPAYIAASESYVAWLQALVDNPGQALRADLISFIVLLQYRQTGFDSRLRGWLQSRQPVYLLQRQGVPLMAIFQKSGP